MLVACAATLALALWQLDVERRVTASERRIDAQNEILMQGIAPPVAAIAPDPVARVKVNQALLLARRAETVAEVPARRALLDRAVSLAERGAAARPAWGEAWMVAAYAYALRDGLTAPATRIALTRSYRGARYLRHAAAWRVPAGLAAWDGLDAATRDAVTDEAVFLSRRGSAAHDAVFELARNSPAYGPFMIRWRALRLTDKPDPDAPR